MRKIIIALFITFIMAAYVHGADPLGDSAKKSGRPLVVDFGKGLCTQCLRQSEAMEEFKKAAGDKIDTRFIHVIEEAKLAGDYRVFMIPTLLFFDRQGKEVFRQVGFMPFDEMMKTAKALGLLVK